MLFCKAHNFGTDPFWRGWRCTFDVLRNQSRENRPNPFELECHWLASEVEFQGGIALLMQACPAVSGVEPDTSLDEYENADDSNRINREFDSNEIDESD
jgi:hypothetical protein